MLEDESYSDHHLFQGESLLEFEDVSDSSNLKASTISLATSHLVINCSESPAMISWFLEVVDNIEAISHQESDLLGSKETPSCV